MEGEIMVICSNNSSVEYIYQFMVELFLSIHPPLPPPLPLSLNIPSLPSSPALLSIMHPYKRIIHILPSSSPSYSSLMKEFLLCRGRVCEYFLFFHLSLTFTHIQPPLHSIDAEWKCTGCVWEFKFLFLHSHIYTQYSLLLFCECSIRYREYTNPLPLPSPSLVVETHPPPPPPLKHITLLSCYL